ncbi:MAG: deoxycytidylate deaminase [Rhodospirillales bacterium]|nr:deoxycytidylate deaminase [Alphaproteobacteria bacterium]MCB9981105.1 deoxycytidylate deaminase [Rhodospirillales bacterium]
MPKNIYAHMQTAVDIVTTSDHPTNKIAATIAGENWALSCVNHWPPVIAEKIGRKADIGNSSGTIHAETALIIEAGQQGHKTNGASVFITDPPCPNCMKNLAEAGIAKLYIDHKGFDKDWAKRRGDDFENMSMRIAERAGIDVFVIYRKDRRFEVISRHAPGYKPSNENPVKIRHCEEAQPTKQSIEAFWIASLSLAMTQHRDEPFALTLATDKDGQCFSIITNCHPTIGYTSQTLEHPDNKYSYILEPLNRLLMNAPRYGLHIDPAHIYSSRVPSARELVNMIGANLTQIQIGDTSTSRDEWGPKALEQLLKTNILTTKS